MSNEKKVNLDSVETSHNDLVVQTPKYEIVGSEPINIMDRVKESPEYNERLQGNDAKKEQGDFVFSAFEMSKTHRNVAKRWQEQCITWDELLQKLTTSDDKNRDKLVEIDKISLQFNDDIGELILHVEDEGEFQLSKWVQSQLAQPSMTGLGYRLLGIGQDSFEKEKIATLFIHRFEKFKLANAGKKRMLRFRNDNEENSIRSILTESYNCISHLFLAEQLRKYCGHKDTLISHFAEDRFENSGGDYCKFNAIIPDSMRVEEDSEYGGMIGLVNGEVGNARLKLLPSILRSICINGCIWGSTSDEKFEISQVHKGKANYNDLEMRIGYNCSKAIPLLPTAVDDLLRTKILTCEIVGQEQQILLSLARKLQLGNEQKRNLLGAHNEEMLLGAFGVVNAFTRFARELGQEQQTEVETFAGGLVESWNNKANAWELVQKNAEKVDMSKELQAIAM